MITLIFVAITILWLVKLILINDFFWATVVTAIILLLFVNVDIKKQETLFKSENEIIKSIDKARDASVSSIKQATKKAKDIERKYKALQNEPDKLDVED